MNFILDSLKLTFIESRIQQDELIEFGILQDVQDELKEFEIYSIEIQYYHKIGDFAKVREIYLELKYINESVKKNCPLTRAIINEFHGRFYL